MTAEMEDREHIFYQQNTPPFRQLHIIGHEVGHLLFGHAGIPTADDEIARMLAQHDPQVLGVLSCGGRGNLREEHEAETFAATLLEYVAPDGDDLEPLFTPEQAELVRRIESAFGAGRQQRR
jgi:Zn-dependent peptidase ImmA (M78 family)